LPPQANIEAKFPPNTGDAFQADERITVAIAPGRSRPGNFPAMKEQEMNFAKTLLAAAALAVSCGANAVVTGALIGSGGSFATLSGPPAGLNTGGSLTGAITAGIVGGAVLTADNTFADDVMPGESFLAAGPTWGTTATMTFTGTPVTFISFLWGSPDTYNTLTVNSTGPGPNSQTFTATGTGFGVAFPVTNGDQTFNQLVSFTAGAGSTITSLVFASSSADAFEAGRFSVTAVPEPETYALLLAGLGALGFVARRRRQA